jgi:uncharacterized phage protein (TIGR02220 family)
MSIIKRHKSENYSVIANQCFRDETISAKAKGIFAYIMTLPEDWKIYRTELIKHFSDGKDSIRSGFDELIEKGYIVQKKSRDEAGRMSGCEYDIYETPLKNNDMAEKPTAENPPSETPPLLSTNKLPITENTKEYIGEDFILGFNKAAGKKIRVLTAKAKSQVSARLKEGFSLPEIMSAAKNCANDDFHRKNPKYLTPEFITRADKLQMYLPDTPSRSSPVSPRGFSI